MDRLEIYKESYYKELERNDNLEDALNMPLSLVSGMLAVLFFFFTSYDYDGKCGLICRVVFLFLMCVATVFVGITTYFLTMSYNKGLKFKGYPYAYLDSLSVIDTFYDSLIKYRADSGGTVTNANEDLEQYLIKNFRDVATINVKLNATRIEYLHRAKMWIVRSLLPIVFSAAFFGYNFYMKDKNNQVEISNQTNKPIPINVINQK